MSTAKKISQVIRKRLLDQAYGSRVAVALSGGVDSCSVLASLMENNVETAVISYTPETHESTDFKMARETASNLGLDFIPVLVPMDADSLEATARYLIGKGFKTKLQVESMTPMVSILRAAGSALKTTMFTGDQADGFFINNNWMARNYDRSQGIPGYLRKPVKEDADATRIDILRDIYWNEDRSCSEAIQSLGVDLGIDVVVPYRDEKIRQAFKGSHWRDVNEPRIKEPIKIAFQDWFSASILTRPLPVNLHRGDSMFADTMGKTLMAQGHLQGEWRTITGLYGAMARGDV